MADGARGDPAQVEVSLALAKWRAEHGWSGIVDWILPTPTCGDALTLFQHVVRTRVANVAPQRILAQPVARTWCIPLICCIRIWWWHFIGQINAALQTSSGAQFTCHSRVHSIVWRYARVGDVRIHIICVICICFQLACGRVLLVRVYCASYTVAVCAVRACLASVVTCSTLIISICGHFIYVWVEASGASGAATCRSYSYYCSVPKVMIDAEVWEHTIATIILVILNSALAITTGVTETRTQLRRTICICCS